MTANEPRITVAIVPHTHWDREWYEPFEGFRDRLIPMFRALLATLESDAQYSHFLLDGQMSMIDDYLEIRPADEHRVRALVESGRVSIGPWMVLMDEFMVSGETIVRNLQLGIRRAHELGGAVQVGYLPDMFGHISQMPQLLASAGLDDAVVWRGVPAAITDTAFTWVAPDGSRVRAEYLYGSYSNALDLPTSGAGLIRMADDYRAELDGGRLGPLLFMNGSDHRSPQPWLGRIVDEANAEDSPYEFIVTSIPRYLDLAACPVSQVCSGELRSAARANLLMGVASNRVDVHQAAAAAERTLERCAEPLAALFLSDDADSATFIERAWRDMVRNSAHDSACACSADDVVQAVLTRYASAKNTARAVIDRARLAIAETVDAPPGSTVFVNPTARTRADVVELTIAGIGPADFVDSDGRALPSQLIGVGITPAFQTVAAGGKIHWVLDVLAKSEAGGTGFASVTIRADRLHRFVEFTPAGPGDEPLDTAGIRERMRMWSDNGSPIRVRIRGIPNRTLVCATPATASFGWNTGQLVDGDPAGDDGAIVGAAGANGLTLRNEHFTLTVDDATGTYAIETVDGVVTRGLGRLVDGGDGGDTYNYCPPDDDSVIDEPVGVTVNVVEYGPVRARAIVTSTYEWPAAAVGDYRRCSARSGAIETTVVTTTIDVCSGEPFARIEHRFDNRSRDHRLRVHFPLPNLVAGSDAECAYAVVRRGLVAEGGPTELALATFPSRRFVDASDGASGVALIHDGLLEYEVVAGREIALTLLRSVGFLSRQDLANRPDPAGPFLPVPAAQLIGPRHARYAVLVHSGDWRAANLYEATDRFATPLLVGRGGGRTRSRAAAGSALSVVGAEVTAVARVEGDLTIRVVRTAAEPGPIAVRGAGESVAISRVDLLDRTIEAVNGDYVARPWEIVTLRVSKLL